jgi:hypothetical protein
MTSFICRFGVCCFFTIATSGAFSENCTYIRNPGFPTATSEAASITYTVNKAQADVCDMRLDFETFDLRGPTDTSAAGETAVCADAMSVLVIPLILLAGCSASYAPRFQGKISKKISNFFFF